MKKIFFLLVTLSYVSAQNISAATLTSSAIKNNTDAPISIILKREITCFGKHQTGNVFSRLEEGQTGLAFLGVAQEDKNEHSSCTSNVTTLMAMQGFKTATITDSNGIVAQDYVVSLKNTPEQEIVIKKSDSKVALKYYIKAKSNTIKNITNAPINIYIKRAIDCPGEPLQTSNIITKLEAGQKGVLYIKGGEKGTCTEHVIELKIVGSGLKSIIKNLKGINAKDYIFSIKTTNIPDTAVPHKELMIE